MTHDEWEAELQRRFTAVREATRAADRWVDLGARGVALDPLQMMEREMDLEEAAAAWVLLMEWMRRPPPGSVGGCMP